MSHLGPLVVSTGQHTGRAPNDKFIVKEPTSEENIWWGKVNVSFDKDRFESLHQRVLACYEGKDVFVQDCYASADPEYRLSLRVVTETAWHNIFTRNMFIKIPSEELAGFNPDFTILNAPNFKADPERDGTNSEVFVILNLEKKARTHWRNELCRRDQKVCFHHYELRFAPRWSRKRHTHNVNALFGKCG